MTVEAFSMPGSTGKGVLLIHGLTGAPGEMKFLGKKLSRRGFHIHAPLLAGHGKDEAYLKSTTWPDWLETVAEAADRFGREVDELYLAGICVGGELGLVHAQNYPDKVKGCAVYSPTFEYDGWNMQTWYSAAPLIKYFANWPLIRDIRFQEPYPFGLKDERLRARVAQSPEALIEGALAFLPMASLYQMYMLGLHLQKTGQTITTPTLIVHAKEDDMSDPKNAYKLQKSLGGPVDLVMLENSYHMVHVDQERDYVADLTAQFFGMPAAEGRRRASANPASDDTKTTTKPEAGPDQEVKSSHA